MPIRSTEQQRAAEIACALTECVPDVLAPDVLDLSAVAVRCVNCSRIIPWHAAVHWDGSIELTWKPR